MKSLLPQLYGGDLRSIGRANEVAGSIGQNQRLFDEVFDGIFGEDPLIRSRSADVVEKAAKQFPHLLQPHKKTLLSNLDRFEQCEVRWHVALMLGYLELKRKELAAVVEVLLRWLDEDDSKIVKVNCLQTLADLAQRNQWLKNEVLMIIQDQMAKESAAIKARGRKLVKQLTGVSAPTIHRT